VSGAMTIPEYELIDHTGDVGIIVRAGSLAALYEKAAAAMFDIILDLETVRPERPYEVGVEALDREDLMVRWLSELLFLYEARRVALSRFDVREVSDSRLAAKAWGEPFDPGRHIARTELKAVTYHEMLVSEDRSGPGGMEGAGWTARIIFDV